MCCPLCRYQEYGRLTVDQIKKEPDTEEITDSTKDDNENNITNLHNYCSLSATAIKQLFNKTQNPLSCHLCSSTFNDSKQLKDHFQKCSNIVCHKCLGNFTKNLLEAHEKSCSIFYCIHCPKRFISEETLKIHQLARHDVYKCDFCTSTFPNALQCEDHKSEKHFFKCELCRKTFDSSLHAVKYRLNTDTYRLLCSLCYEASQYKPKVIPMEPLRRFIKEEISNSPTASQLPQVKTNKQLNVNTKDSNKKNVKTANQYEIKILNEDGTFILPGNNETVGAGDSTVQYMCFYCEEASSSFSELNNHLKVCHNIELQELSVPEEEEEDDKTYQDALEKYENKIDNLFDTAIPLTEFESQLQYNCVICDKIYKSFSTYCRHVYRTHRINTLLGTSKKYHCHECRVEKNKMSELNNHLYIRHENFFNCEYCDKIFSSKKDRRIHALTDHPEQPAFTCIECSMKFATHDELKQHCSWHWFHEAIDCVTCNKRIKGRKKYKTHVNYHKLRGIDGVTGLNCPECNKTLASKTSLNTHMRFVHRGGKLETILCGECGILVSARRFSKHHDRFHSKGRVFRCQICPRAFFSKELLRQHSDTHIEGRPHECDLCPAAFKQLRNLRMHIRNIHSESTTSCKFCDITFENTEAYAEHRRIVHKKQSKFVKLQSEGGFQCTRCPKIMKTMRAVASHVRIAHEQHLHVKCHVCNQEFPFMRQLQNHMSTHTEPKPDLSCSFCQRSFTTLGSLNSHIKWVHIGDRNFPCSYCPAKFKRKDAQIVHERTHTDERPYMCNVCQRKFRQRTDCKRHEAKHSMPGFRYNKPHRTRPRIATTATTDSTAPEVVIEEVVEGEGEGLAQAETLMLLEVPTQEDQQAAAFLSYIVQA